MSKTKQLTRYAVYAWRDDGMYHKGAPVNGLDYYQREHAAQKAADKLNASDDWMRLNPRGYVVRVVQSIHYPFSE